MDCKSPNPTTKIWCNIVCCYKQFYFRYDNDGPKTTARYLYNGVYYYCKNRDAKAGVSAGATYDARLIMTSNLQMFNGWTSLERDGEQFWFELRICII